MRKAVLSGTLGGSQVTPLEFMTRKVIWIGFHSAKGTRMVDVFFVNKEDCTKIDDSFLSPNKRERAGVEYWPKGVRLFLFVFPLSLQHSINFFSLLKHKQTFHFSKPCEKRVNLAANNRSLTRTDIKREWKGLTIYSKRSSREKCKYCPVDTLLLFSEFPEILVALDGQLWPRWVPCNRRRIEETKSELSFLQRSGKWLKVQAWKTQFLSISLFFLST